MAYDITANKAIACCFYVHSNWHGKQLTVMLFCLSFDCSRRGQCSSVLPALATTSTIFLPLTLYLLSSGFTSYICQLRGVGCSTERHIILAMGHD